jgi:hypothetical protein
MNIGKHVCSFESAKKLKELGVEQNSLFFYRAFENPLDGVMNEETCPQKNWSLHYFDDKHSKSCDFEISAFTSAELGKLIPAKVFDNGLVYSVDFCKIEKIWGCSYSLIQFFYSDNEAESRAQLLIWLLEEVKKGILKL